MCMKSDQLFHCFCWPRFVNWTNFFQCFFDLFWNRTNFFNVYIYIYMYRCIYIHIHMHNVYTYICIYIVTYMCMKYFFAVSSLAVFEEAPERYLSQLRASLAMPLLVPEPVLSTPDIRSAWLQVIIWIHLRGLILGFSVGVIKGGSLPISWPFRLNSLCSETKKFIDTPKQNNPQAPNRTTHCLSVCVSIHKQTDSDCVTCSLLAQALLCVAMADGLF